MPTLSKPRFDSLSPVVEEVVKDILDAGDVVVPIDVLQKLEVVDSDQVELWRRGGLPYLERAMTSGLSRVARLLRLLTEHCLSLGLEPAPGKYWSRGKGARRRLRFSKRGDEASEKLYSTHFARRRAEAGGSRDG